ncbi:hypothetical protein CMI37_06090 [Candidatus Pacearchaeota archaeon]|nr:hypothetical protein [Candidatus Pacearchaeota archaeon]
MSFKEDFSAYYRAGYPLLYVTAAEPERAINAIENLSADIGGGVPVSTWRYTDGWDHTNPASRQQQTGEPNDPILALEQIGQKPAGSISVLENYHLCYGKEAMIDFIQPLIDGYYNWRQAGKQHTAVIVASVLQIPEELKRFIQIIPYTLPNKETITEIIDSQIRAYDFLKTTKTIKEAVIANASGMTEDEVENAVALSMVKTRKIKKDGTVTACLDPDIFMSEKAKTLEKGGLITYEPFTDDMNSVGGLDNLKRWLEEEKRSVMDPKAREFGIDAPKGVFLLGLPGTGKSLSAKCVAREWGLPLMHFDLSKIFGSLVGQSEENMRTALDQIEALSPAVVWVDEIEKGMAGVESSGNFDSGVTKRVFGQLLTWMEERPSDKVIYLVVTANSVSGLPPALLSRFDSLFWVDLPNATDRERILEIHLEKRSQLTDLVKLGMKDMSNATNGFSGREIEKVVLKGMKKAFARDEELNATHVIESAEGLVPVSVLNAEELENDRRWAVDRCEFAQDGEMVKVTPKPRKNPSETIRGVNLN